MTGPVSDNKKVQFARERSSSANLLDQPILSQNLLGKHARLERRFLAGIFENSNQCMRPEEMKFERHQWSYRPQIAYFSSISLSLRYLSDSADQSHYEFLDNTPFKHLTYSDKISIKQFEELVLESIEVSIKQMDEDGGAGQSERLIAINEFGFPFFRQDDRRSAFMNKLRTISDDRNAYILCGSSHCMRRKQNIAVFARPSGQDVIEHAKFSPAINLGEKLQPRHDLFWKYYATSLGRIGVLICFDAIDPSVILRQVYFSRDVPADNRINLYIVPTFSPNDRVRDQAEVLSYLTKSVVLYVNCQYHDSQSATSQPSVESPRMQSHALFIAGEDVTNDSGISGSDFGACISRLDNSVHSGSGGDESMWASIVTHRTEYRSILHDLLERHDSFSPLMKEILSLAKPDPSFRRPRP